MNRLVADIMLQQIQCMSNTTSLLMMKWVWVVDALIDRPKLIRGQIDNTVGSRF